MVSGTLKAVDSLRTIDVDLCLDSTVVVEQAADRLRANPSAAAASQEP
jgi:hypothetical protein